MWNLGDVMRGIYSVGLLGFWVPKYGNKIA